MMNQTELKTILDYDPETGWFTNKYDRMRAYKGERAGSVMARGYRKIVISQVFYYEHQLAWLYVYGEWPERIDHKNGVFSDNRIANLRLCTQSQNLCNRPTPVGESGLKGAYLDKRRLTWRSSIQFGGQQKHLGTFKTAEEAHRAHMVAVEQLHGEFAYHKRPTE